MDERQATSSSEKIDHILIARAQSFLQNKMKDRPLIVQQTTETFDLLTGWPIGNRALVAALLLPLIRSELLSEQDLIMRFGSRPVNLARTVLRLITSDNPVDGRKKPPQRMFQAEKLRRMFITAYSDVDAVLVCVADHLARASYLNEVSEQEQQLWAQENTSVYVPLTEMLGLWSYRHVLADLSLSLTDKAQYEKCESKVTAYCQRHEMLFSQIAPELLHRLELEGVHDAEINLHETTPANLYRRQQQSTHDESAMLRIDVLLETERDCYHALGIIHNRWSPVNRPISTASPVSEERFSDTIAAPRYNGYRCLITTVMADENRLSPRLAEFRIRTKAMEQVNIRGVLGARIDPIPVRNAWWNDKAAADLLNARDTQTLTGDICVFTGAGEVVYPLRKGTTVIDLAFKTNPALAPYIGDIHVNGAAVGHDYELRHRDLVEMAHDARYPALKPEWEDFARTSSARAMIRRFLKQQERSPHHGRALIDAALARETEIYEMRYPAERAEQTLIRLARRYLCSSLDTLYLRVAEGEILAEELANAMIEDELVGHIVLENGDSWPLDKMQIARTWGHEQGQSDRH
ncbi:MAG: bifunctional (p)ppGpp synthetase/guanosine-3',5'-bis(diphosphate) 3'-pyrophosphohydrolase, partial [Chitinophagaceae bacterium]|nr:bifunctional (p)ppGpp synthetase/guanosine-3',5'-bis(diphosphate) 3'-pyrophosphohydrolase [Anaerolineae bacterium]